VELIWVFGAKYYELSFLILKYHWHCAFLLSVVCGPLDISSNPYIFLIFEQHSSQQLETILAAEVVSMNSNLNFVRRLIIDMCDSFSIILLKSPQDSAVSPDFPESKNRFLI